MATPLADIMTYLGIALEDVAPLRVYPFPPKSAQPPFAFVDMPDSVDYDLTMGRGSDRFTLKVYVGVADVVDRATQAALAGFAAGDGALSVKQAIEAKRGFVLDSPAFGVLDVSSLASIVGSLRVTRAEFGRITLAAGEYAGITFLVDVAG